MTRPAVDPSTFTSTFPKPHSLWHGGVHYLVNQLVLDRDETFPLPALTDRTEALQLALRLTAVADEALDRLMALAGRRQAVKPRRNWLGRIGE